MVHKTLRAISTQLRSLRIDGQFMVGPELFWPTTTNTISTESDATMPIWPHLEDFVLKSNSRPRWNLNITYPDHRPWFNWGWAPAPAPRPSLSPSPPRSPATPRDAELERIRARNEHMYSSGLVPRPPEKVPVLQKTPHAFNEVILAVSRAMLHMPRLRLLSLEAPVEVKKAASCYSRSSSTRTTRRRQGNILAKWPFYYTKEVATEEADSGFGVYGPMAEFSRFVGWVPPAEVLENWAMLRRRVRGHDRFS